jgi:phosphoglycerate dehydrogenase-like enzyme
MKTVVAETVLLGREAFKTLGEVVVIPDRQIGPEHLKDADALVIRSKTKVTPQLLAGSAVRFVGTATAGFEHMDFEYLESNKIGWCAAPGCNADSVADYMTSVLLTLYAKHGVELEGKTIASSVSDRSDRASPDVRKLSDCAFCSTTRPAPRGREKQDSRRWKNCWPNPISLRCMFR